VTAPSDAVARRFVGARAIAEAIPGPTDAPTSVVAFARAIAESVESPTDSVAFVVGLAVAIAESIPGATDSPARAFVGYRTIAEFIVSPTDAVQAATSGGSPGPFGFHLSAESILDFDLSGKSLLGFDLSADSILHFRLTIALIGAEGQAMVLPEKVLPGTGVRFFVDITTFGVPVDPPNLSFVAVDPQGNVNNVTMAPTETGQWQGDFLVPANAAFGTWKVRAASTGSAPAQNKAEQGSFYVEALSF